MSWSTQTSSICWRSRIIKRQFKNDQDKKLNKYLVTGSALSKKDNTKDESAKKRQASDLLKNADKLLKSEDYRGALQEIDKALELDPGNFYARAYKDRIFTQLEHLGESFEDDDTQKKTGGQLKQKIHADRHRADEEHKRQEADHQRADTELRRRGQEVETRRLEEEDVRRQFDEERRKHEAETKKKLGDERKRLEEETRKRIEEERQRLQEEIKKKEELSRLKAEEEAQRRAEEEKRKRREEIEEQERRRVEEDRRQREMEDRRRAEEQAKRRLEEELRKRLEVERIRKREEQMILAAREEGRQEAVQQKIIEYLTCTKDMIAQQNNDAALFEIQKIFLLDPENSEATQLEQIVQSQKQVQDTNRLSEMSSLPHSINTELFRDGVKIAWKDGIPTEELQTLISELASALSITPDEKRAITEQAKTDVYTDAMFAAWQDGALSPVEVKHLEMLRQELPITAEDHLTIEQQVRKKLGY
ncbi:MAG: hypothetical protein C0417_07265 [Chlorobiaceae bacterium]|nr:hypothetical protein [Chlorobiaceae bacterium]